MLAKKISQSVFLCQRNKYYRFKLKDSMLNPAKHTTLAHTISSISMDLYEYGKFDDLVFVGSEPPRHYQPQILQIITSTINAKYGTKLTANELWEKKNKSWSRFLRKDLNIQTSIGDLYPELLGKLSTNIILKESRITWINQQKLRYFYTMDSFDADIPHTIEDFVHHYNQDLQKLVLLSNLGFSAEIDQAPSALEKHEFNESYSVKNRLSELSNLKPEHNNIFNRILAFLH